MNMTAMSAGFTFLKVGGEGRFGGSFRMAAEMAD